MPLAAGAISGGRDGEFRGDNALYRDSAEWARLLCLWVFLPFEQALQAEVAVSARLHPRNLHVIFTDDARVIPLLLVDLD